MIFPWVYLGSFFVKKFLDKKSIVFVKFNPKTKGIVSSAQLALSDLLLM